MLQIPSNDLTIPQEKVLMMSISQTQDPQVSYPTTHIVAILSRALISTKRLILMAVFTRVNGIFRYFGY